MNTTIRNSLSYQPDAAAFVLDRTAVLLVGGGFVLAVVATGKLYGKLYIYDLLVGLLALFFMLGWLAAPRILPVRRADLAIILGILLYGSVMAVVAATLVTETPRPAVQVMFLARTFGLFTVFVAFLFIASRWPTTVRVGFLLTAFLLIAYVAQSLITGDLTGYYNYLDIPGTTAPLQSGFTFGILAVLCLGITVVSSSIWKQLVYALLAVCLGFSAIGTISRTNTLAVVFTFALMPGIWAIVNRKYWQMSLLCVVLVVAVGLAAVAYLSGLLPDALHEPVSNALRRLSRFQSSSGLRASHWASYFQDAPVPVTIYWLTGLGMGAQSVLSGTGAGFTLGFDSLYLRLFFEWGVIGLVLWGTFYWRVVLRVRRCARTLLVPLILVLIYGAVVGITHEWLFVGVAGYLYMAIVGSLLGWAEYERRGQLLKSRRGCPTGND